MSFLILNGPNLNLLGVRDTALYGTVSFEAFLEDLRAQFPDEPIAYFQTNHEGSIIDKLHETGFTVDGIILNPGAYGHTSIAIRDAIGAISAPVVEVHITDIAKREAFRHHSMIADVCIAQIAGRGLDGYTQALKLLIAQRPSGN